MVLRILLADVLLRIRGFHSLRPAFPKPFSCSLSMPFAVHTPECTHSGLGSFPFARRYSGNRCFFLFLRVLRCFSSPGSLCTPMDSVHSDRGLLCQVSPFRNLWVTGYLLLTTAYRSLSRLSSALSAKASTLCSFLLDQSLIRFFVSSVFLPIRSVISVGLHNQSLHDWLHVSLTFLLGVWIFD